VYAVTTVQDEVVMLRFESAGAGQLSGTVEWYDVFPQVESEIPVDLSQCDGVNCGQPSLSADGHWLVFLKTTAE
jgi:hypothetical protein